MKKAFLIITVFLIGIQSLVAFDVNIKSENVILYNLTSDKIIYEKNSQEKTKIASLTKIMTVLTALDKVNVEDEVTLKNNDFKGLIENDASIAGFEVGDKVTYLDLFYGALLPSGAEATLALANNISGSEEAFVLFMNEKAKSIGMNNTQFKNVSGLDVDGAYSTVEDVLKMVKYAIKNQTFKTIFTTDTYITSNGLKFNGVLKNAASKYNINVEYILGNKTGFTDDAGLCLASYVKKDDQEFILITTKAFYEDTYFPYNITDAKEIYDYLFESYSNQLLIPKGKKILSLKTENASKDSINIYANNDIYNYMENNYDVNKLSFKYNGIEILTSKNKINEKIGTYHVYYNNEEIGKTDVYLEEKINFSLIKYIINNKLLFIVIGSGLVIILTSIVIVKNNQKKKRAKIC